MLAGDTSSNSADANYFEIPINYNRRISGRYYEIIQGFLLVLSFRHHIRLRARCILLSLNLYVNVNNILCNIVLIVSIFIFRIHLDTRSDGWKLFRLIGDQIMSTWKWKIASCSRYSAYLLSHVLLQNLRYCSLNIGTHSHFLFMLLCDPFILRKNIF